ncbi:MAG: hypothetical protein KKG59_04280 [Nanoarchaeota archaeon]|nr:hypothetical protein [Nanoarchaeota archaeon]
MNKKGGLFILITMVVAVAIFLLLYGYVGSQQVEKPEYECDLWWGGYLCFKWHEIETDPADKPESNRDYEIEY